MQIAHDGLAERERPYEVLLLDDSEFDRKRLKRSMTKAAGPCTIAEAESLAAMGNLLEAKAYDMILLDYALEDGNGIDALKLCKAAPLNAQTLFVMVTGSDSDVLETNALRAGFDTFLTKDGINADILVDLAAIARNKQRARGPVSNQAGADAIEPGSQDGLKPYPKAATAEFDIDAFAALLHSSGLLANLPEPSLTLVTAEAAAANAAGHTAIVIKMTEDTAFFDFRGAQAGTTLLSAQQSPHDTGDLMAPDAVHLAVQVMPITPAIAAVALRRARNYGAVPRAFGTRAICDVLAGVPGFEDLPNTFFARRLSHYFRDVLGAQQIDSTAQEGRRNKEHGARAREAANNSAIRFVPITPKPVKSKLTPVRPKRPWGL